MGHTRVIPSMAAGESNKDAAVGQQQT